MICAITGAGSGIGRALAVRFAEEGASIVGVDADSGGWRETAAALGSGTAARFVEADLATPEGIAKAANGLLDPSPDIVIHCAGISAVGAFQDVDEDLHARVLDVNLVAPLVLTTRLLQGGAPAPGGSLVFVSSLSEYVGYPGAASYAASKSGLAAYARSLRVALRSREINVLTVFPGPTQTPHARRYSPDNSRENRRMPADAVATLIHRAVTRRRRVLIPGAANRLKAMAGLWMPGVIDRIMRKAVFERVEEPLT